MSSVVVELVELVDQYFRVLARSEPLSFPATTVLSSRLLAPVAAPVLPMSGSRGTPSPDDSL